MDTISLDGSYQDLTVDGKRTDQLIDSRSQENENILTSVSLFAQIMDIVYYLGYRATVQSGDRVIKFSDVNSDGQDVGSFKNTFRVFTQSIENMIDAAITNVKIMSKRFVREGIRRDTVMPIDSFIKMLQDCQIIVNTQIEERTPFRIHYLRNDSDIYAVRSINMIDDLVRFDVSCRSNRFSGILGVQNAISLIGQFQDVFSQYVSKSSDILRRLISATVDDIDKMKSEINNLVFYQLVIGNIGRYYSNNAFKVLEDCMRHSSYTITVSDVFFSILGSRALELCRSFRDKNNIDAKNMFRMYTDGAYRDSLIEQSIKHFSLSQDDVMRRDLRLFSSSDLIIKIFSR